MFSSPSPDDRLPVVVVVMTVCGMMVRKKDSNNFSFRKTTLEVQLLRTGSDWTPHPRQSPGKTNPNLSGDPFHSKGQHYSKNHARAHTLSETMNHTHTLHAHTLAPWWTSKGSVEHWFCCYLLQKVSERVRCWWSASDWNCFISEGFDHE